ncbi:hypothetical protein [Micromonospora sp. WMMD1082]|uniref:hypothetical protein n=1 Tax=Micromonospora sp. WMMD1082 TaxID=3016104 RepID=UPI00241750DB|nr:hypothetical protein [Micromonospora sp. WMMD1082]MDG4796409.1 hypothetical protein [Micromonospora sp. WMMD1082]
MNDLLTPPADRDLPAGRAGQMRARLLADLGVGPRRSPVRRRVALALVAAVAVAALGLVAWPEHDRAPRYLAFGPDELSPTLRQSAERCLALGDDPARMPVTIADLAVAVERGDHAALMFLTDDHYLACDFWDPPHQPWPDGGAPSPRLASPARSTAVASSVDDPTWRGDWLPGPVQRLLLTSTDPDGGEVVAIGRVGARVHRLVIEHADGRTAPARISGGAFGLIADDGDIRDDGGADLVAYDRAGVEIDRRPLFTPFDQLGRCYVDPAGAVVYGDPGPTCQPAEPWHRRR